MIVLFYMMLFEICVSDDFGYLGKNLSEPKLNIIQMFELCTGCEPKLYI